MAAALIAFFCVAIPVCYVLDVWKVRDIIDGVIDFFRNR